MALAREVTILFLPRGKLTTILTAFDDTDKIKVLAMTLCSSASTKNYVEHLVGPLKIRVTRHAVSYIPVQTLDKKKCNDLIENYDTYADEVYLLTRENLLDDERVYVTSIDVLDKAHNWTVRFRVLEKEEREYTERYQRIIRETREHFTTSLEFDNNLRKQIQHRDESKATQRIRRVLKQSETTPIQLQGIIPNIYESEAVGKRIVLMTSESYIRMKEISDRYEDTHSRIREQELTE